MKKPDREQFEYAYFNTCNIKIQNLDSNNNESLCLSLTLCSYHRYLIQRKKYQCLFLYGLGWWTSVLCLKNKSCKS